MPPTRASGQRSGRTTAATIRAASVPVSRPENARLESLRLKRFEASSVPDDKNISPTGSPSVVITRARKRNSSSTTSASVVAPIPDANEQHPRKRQKRSLSTPPTTKPSQLPSRRCSRSRAGSPESVAPLARASVRRRIQSFINARSSDIYTHLAGPDGAGDLLSEPAGSVILSTPIETVGSQPVQKPRGRRRKTVDLTDENAKKDLMEEWAEMRQSRGISGIDENSRCSKVHSRDTRKSEGCSPNISTEETQGTIPDHSYMGSLPARVDTENALSTDKMANHTNTSLPEQPIALGDIKVPPPDLRIEGGVSDGKPTGVPETTRDPNLLQHSTSLREGCVVTKVSTSDLVGVANLDNPLMGDHSDDSPQTHLFDKNDICLDSDEEFYMLDISEIFTLPWEPVASHLYVPPGLGKLISGMREQLMIETRARRRAEDLYQAELNRRIFAEKTIKDLRAELERRGKQTHSEDLDGRCLNSLG